MDKIETALLSEQRSTVVNGVYIDLNPPLKRDTRKNREKEAKRRTKEIIKVLNELNNGRFFR